MSSASKSTIQGQIENKTANVAWHTKYSVQTHFKLVKTLAPVVQTLDSAIHRINHYQVDEYYGNQLRYLLDSDLSGG